MALSLLTIGHGCRNPRRDDVVPGRITDQRLVEQYRAGFGSLDPHTLGGIWDRSHDRLIYVAQEVAEPFYGWPAIESYYDSLPLSHPASRVIEMRVEDLTIDVLGDVATAFCRCPLRRRGRRPAGAVHRHWTGHIRVPADRPRMGGGPLSRSARPTAQSALAQACQKTDLTQPYRPRGTSITRLTTATAGLMP